MKKIRTIYGKQPVWAKIIISGIAGTLLYYYGKGFIAGFKQEDSQP